MKQPTVNLKDTPFEILPGVSSRPPPSFCSLISDISGGLEKTSQCNVLDEVPSFTIKELQLATGESEKQKLN